MPILKKVFSHVLSRGGVLPPYINNRPLTKEASMFRYFIIAAALLTAAEMCFGQVHLSGSLSGILQDTTYIVDDNISVDAGDSLIILPGAVFLFSGEYDFDVDGFLSAEGTVLDSIVFQAQTVWDNWGSMNFNSSSSDSGKISYCYFTRANGSGINCYESDIAIIHTTFKENSASYGGGIYGSSSDLIISNCVIENNNAIKGGGIYLTGDYFVTIDSCTISSNMAAGQVYSSGGGIGIGTGTGYLNLTNSIVTSNQAAAPGGGIAGRCDNVHNCLFDGNTASSSVGGGAYVFGDNLVISRCTFSNNSAPEGGGLYVNYSDLLIDSCTFTGNLGTNSAAAFKIAAQGYTYSVRNSDFYDNEGPGPAIYAEANAVELYNCNIHDNNTTGGGIYLDHIYENSSIVSCSIHHNQGDGLSIEISADNTEMLIDSCLISYNSSEGISVVFPDDTLFCRNTEISHNGSNGIKLDYANAVLFRCNIFSNNTTFNGGGIYCIEADLLVENCTIAGNSAANIGGGIFTDNYSDYPVQIINSIVSQNQPHNIYLNRANVNTTLEFSCIYSAAGNNFAGEIPGEWGLLNMVNSNGDSCDAFNNIYLEPLFVDVAADDYHLQVNSPCIDAGNPLSPYDPDSTIADMGAFFYDQSVEVESSPNSVLPAEFNLSVYPNPFNSSTSIRYSLAKAGEMEMTVYDIAGRAAVKLASGWRTEGEYQVGFDGDGLASGIYFVRLQAGDFAQTRKMALVK